MNVLPRMYSELKDTVVIPSIRSVEYCALTTVAGPVVTMRVMLGLLFTF